MRAPALYALLFFVGGIAIASHTVIPAMAYLGAAAIATAAAVVYSLAERTVFSRTALCLALLSSSGFLTSLQLYEVPSNHISHFAGFSGKSAILGWVDTEPDVRPTKTFLTVAAESLSRHGVTIAVSGRIRVRLPRPINAFNIGDRIKFQGFLVKPSGSRNPGGFDYRRYLEIRLISAVCNLGAYDQIERVEAIEERGFIRIIVVPVREYIAWVFDEYLTSDRSALMRGFLIGDVRFIPNEVYQRFRDTGTLHVLAASGSNVGYVTLTIFLVAKLFRLPRRSRYLLAIAGVMIFSFLAYNQPSVVRASIMAIVALIGMSLRRDQNWLNTISVAGLILLAVHPLYLYDLGTQLSFAAAFALILFMPALEPLLPTGKRIPTRISRYFLLIFFGSLVAQFGVMPILLYHFHTVPLVSFLSNLIIVPLVGLAATTGIVLVFVSAIPVVAATCGLLLEFLLEAILWATQFFDSLQIPPLQIGAPEFLTVLAYYLFLQVLLTLGIRSRHFLSFLLLFVIALNSIVWKAVIADSDRATRISILDTSRLTTLFIEEANGKTTLINGGGRSQFFDAGESVVLPFLQYRGINAIGEICRTTERDGNLQSLVGIAETIGFGTAGEAPPKEDCFQSLDAIIRLKIDSVSLVFLTEPIAVRNLNSGDGSATILGLDWTFLTNDFADTLIEMFQPETVIFTNYYNRYARRDKLDALRTRFPEIRIVSVLEIGAIEIPVSRNQYLLTSAANN